MNVCFYDLFCMYVELQTVTPVVAFEKSMKYSVPQSL